MVSVFMMTHQSSVRCDGKTRSQARAIEDQSRERQGVANDEVHIGIIAAGYYISTCGTAPFIIIAAI